MVLRRSDRPALLRGAGRGRLLDHAVAMVGLFGLVVGNQRTRVVPAFGGNLVTCLADSLDGGTVRPWGPWDRTTVGPWDCRTVGPSAVVPPCRRAVVACPSRVRTSAGGCEICGYSVALAFRLHVTRRGGTPRPTFRHDSVHMILFFLPASRRPARVGIVEGLDNSARPRRLPRPSSSKRRTRGRRRGRGRSAWNRRILNDQCRSADADFDIQHSTVRCSAAACLTPPRRPARPVASRAGRPGGRRRRWRGRS